jgi:Cu+-exporting ATPase
MNTIVLDKTGTITAGKPALTDVVTTGDVPENDLLRLVASAERGSEHPLGEAIVRGAEERGLLPAPVSGFNAIAGHGIEATVEGRNLLLGNAKLMRDRGVEVGTFEERAAALSAEGKTPMFVAVEGRMAGLVAVADTVKPESRRRLRPCSAGAGGRDDDRRQPAHRRGRSRSRSALPACWPRCCPRARPPR